MSELRRSPLDAVHRKLGARMVPFAGFEMPVQYTSILEEHAAARERAALFDVSHMGQIHLEGPGAVAAAERLVTCPVDSLRPGRVRYGCLCNEEGGVVDDVTVYRLREDALFFCVNAANIEKDRRWIAERAGRKVAVEDRSPQTALLALQGPASPEILSRGTEAAATLRRFRFVEIRLAGASVLISRTGYTGSDGFEIYSGADAAEALWAEIADWGRDAGLAPAGLGARDTLRLEAALPLYGHELDDSTSPLEARLDRFVKLERGGFIGAEAISRRRAAGHRRLLAGFELLERGIARAGHPIARPADGEKVGVVTSGGPSPTLGKSIGLGYVPPALAEPGTELDVVVRGRAIRARVVETPFVRLPPRSEPSTEPKMESRTRPDPEPRT